jgi:hypothetical protein
MSYSSSNSNRFTKTNSEQKNEIVQTIPERDIALCSPNNINILNRNSPSFLINNNPSNIPVTVTKKYHNNQMNQFNNNNENTNNNIQYSNHRELNSNMSKLSINGSGNYQHNAYQYNNQSEQQYLKSHYEYNNYNHQNNSNKHYLMQQGTMIQVK